ncbi:glutathione binding-like protein [Alcaligenes sp. A-TC2]|jgi:GST-like protein|uniref:Glutathione binding-like protein n=1 Tax=Alcaligenes faecalis TaxID=511 RepID=A0AAE9KR95_ALCFA|nr:MULTISPECIES: glutathione binding-like protein [Alcaligenes]MCX5470364.1 glutathione binding-like protein [Alcaligenes nematophilus]ULH05240.1 glutathione binding-like protein [Alcaligenes faecalis]UPL23015.1 glutathione binding-like protein [Alcaligenes faecalis]
MTQASDLVFYTADTPNGQKVSIFLKEAGLVYEQFDLDLDRGDQHQTDFLKINPNGKIPAIVDRKSGLTVFESGAILSYLSSRTGCLLPATEAENVAVQQWLHFQIGSIGPMLGQLWWFLHGSKTGNAEAIQRYQTQSLRLYQVVDSRLSESAFIASENYSIADIAAFTWLRTWGELSLDITAYTHVQRWLEVIAARPAVQAGLLANKPTAPSCR